MFSDGIIHQFIWDGIEYHIFIIAQLAKMVYCREEERMNAGNKRQGKIVSVCYNDILKVFKTF